MDGKGPTGPAPYVRSTEHGLGVATGTQLPANRMLNTDLVYELHQITPLERGAVEAQYQLPATAAPRSQRLQGMQARRLQGVIDHVEHLLHIGAILAADLQPVVVAMLPAAQPERQQTTAQPAQQGMGPDGDRRC